MNSCSISGGIKWKFSIPSRLRLICEISSGTYVILSEVSVGWVEQDV